MTTVSLIWLRSSLWLSSTASLIFAGIYPLSVITSVSISSAAAPPSLFLKVKSMVENIPQSP
ncbi:hypothetical protein BRARA_F01656 [Brassica rapa]|uniref:Uncharacterized protein n=1 Tax=Brassica campestris TaxID=3711 RepID=A0A397Z4V8_BRACM|nr:hypothetical protein BRARA_F01656 [Brassica rapa]